MLTKAALTPSKLEDEIQNHIAMATSPLQPQEPIATKNHADLPTLPRMSSEDKKETSPSCQQNPSSSDSKQSTQVQSRSNSSRPSKTPSTDQPMSLKNLQEMVIPKDMDFISLKVSHFQALTTFCSENWIQEKHKIIEVELERDPVLGLG